MARSPLHYLFLFATLLVSSTHALVPVAQSPLAGTGDTDGPNVLLALSIEYPTASWAYSGIWKKDNEYLGYFNPDVCYRYVENDSAADVKGVKYFKPVTWVRDKVNRSCDKPYWSGNFLNWAAGTATDIFRKALTGGYRLVDSDTSGATILRLSRHGYGEERRTAADSTVSSYVPVAYAGAQVTIQ